MKKSNENIIESLRMESCSIYVSTSLMYEAFIRRNTSNYDINIILPYLDNTIALSIAGFFELIHTDQAEAFEHLDTICNEIKDIYRQIKKQRQNETEAAH